LSLTRFTSAQNQFEALRIPPAHLARPADISTRFHPPAHPHPKVTPRVRHVCLTLMATATVRELRNQFPKVRKLLERFGEVLISDHGTPLYRLTLYTEPATAKTDAVDY